MQTNYWLVVLVTALLPVLGGCGDSGPDASPDNAVTLANLNVLHGFDCDSAQLDTGQCRVQERIALLAQHLVAAGCPDLVTLQEVINAAIAPTELAQPVISILDLVRTELPGLAAACGFTYELLYRPLLAVTLAEIDEELILSRYPILLSGTRTLYGPLYNEAAGVLVFARHVLHARVDHPTGEIDVYTTHLASGADLARSPCGDRFCPPECDSADTVRACQAVQLAHYVEATRLPGNLALISGDFNAAPGSTEYRTALDRGWIDTHLAAGQPECDAVSGVACTSGRESSIGQIEDPALNVQRRIDYIFAALPRNEGNCTVAAAGAATRRGVYTVDSAGLFADRPNPFSADCGPSPAPPCWVSDHSGNRATLACERGE